MSFDSSQSLHLPALSALLEDYSQRTGEAAEAQVRIGSGELLDLALTRKEGGLIAEPVLVQEFMLAVDRLAKDGTLPANCELRLETLQTDAAPHDAAQDNDVQGPGNLSAVPYAQNDGFLLRKTLLDLGHRHGWRMRDVEDASIKFGYEPLPEIRFYRSVVKEGKVGEGPCGDILASDIEADFGHRYFAKADIELPAPTPSDVVQPMLTNNKWVELAHDPENLYAADLAPGAAGEIGQIIARPSAEPQVPHLVARSLAQFVTGDWVPQAYETESSSGEQPPQALYWTAVASVLEPAVETVSEPNVEAAAEAAAQAEASAPSSTPQPAGEDAGLAEETRLIAMEDDEDFPAPLAREADSEEVAQATFVDESAAFAEPTESAESADTTEPTDSGEVEQSSEAEESTDNPEEELTETSGQANPFEPANLGFIEPVASVEQNDVVPSKPEIQEPDFPEDHENMVPDVPTQGEVQTLSAQDILAGREAELNRGEDYQNGSSVNAESFHPNQSQDKPAFDFAAEFSAIQARLAAAKEAEEASAKPTEHPEIEEEAEATESTVEEDSTPEPERFPWEYPGDVEEESEHFPWEYPGDDAEAQAQQITSDEVADSGSAEEPSEKSSAYRSQIEVLLDREVEQPVSEVPHDDANLNEKNANTEATESSEQDSKGSLRANHNASPRSDRPAYTNPFEQTRKDLEPDEGNFISGLRKFFLR